MRSIRDWSRKLFFGSLNRCSARFSASSRLFSSPNNVACFLSVSIRSPAFVAAEISPSSKALACFLRCASNSTSALNNTGFSLSSFILAEILLISSVLPESSAFNKAELYFSRSFSSALCVSSKLSSSGFIKSAFGSFCSINGRCFSKFFWSSSRPLCC